VNTVGVISARGVLRRVLIWGLVAVFFALVITLAVLGEYTAILGFSAFPVVGAIILISRPGNGVGWYLLGVGIMCLAIMWGLDEHLTALAPPWAESAMNAIAGGFWLGLLAIGVLFPSGRLETRLGRIAFWSIAALALVEVGVALVDPAPMTTTGRANPFAVSGLAFLPFYVQIAFPIVFVGIVVAVIVDLVLRWRRATVLERLQYRWFVFSLVGLISIVLIAWLASVYAGGEIYSQILLVVATLALNLIPISIGVAVTRHGLYEIGRVVSRTVSYGIVTLLVVGIYAIVVTSLTTLLPKLPSVGIALATLASAAVFLPVLRWVQRVINRRFDREWYDANKVVEAFGEHLRTDVNPDSTAREFIEAVEKSLQPASVGLWTIGGTR
jgi:hypothetical protein